MKKALLTLSLLVASTSFALDGKKLMEQQEAILKSKDVAALVAKNGGQQVDTIDYKSTGDKLIGPAYFEVKFEASKDGASVICTFTAHVNTQSLEVMGATPAVCK